MANEKNIALDNLDKVIKNIDKTETISTDAHLDIVTADAYVDSKMSAEHCDSVKTELDKQAEDVITDNPVAPDVKEKNMYTKLVLDESIEDFYLYSNQVNIPTVDEDEYLDYDMFDFVYGLVTDDWPRPKNPLGRRMRKFQHTDSDDYLKTNTPTGMSQVSTDDDGNVVVYANDVNAFNDIREVCDYYHLTYSDVRPRVSKLSHWAFNMTIYVPMSSEGYPVMVEDFFAQYGWTLSDVIEDHKVGKGKSSNWGATYNQKVEKDRQELVNEHEVEKIFDKFVERASLNGDIPLQTFVKDMFAELDANNLSYGKGALKKRFMDEFKDDFEDED